MRLDDTDRLEAFSDGVMAVIITIMAFNVKPPIGASLSATHAVLPELLVYVLSFTMIAIYWNNHHHLLRSTDRMDGSVMWSNMFLLFWLSLVPVVTGWVGKYPNHALPAATYGIVALGSALAYSILVRFIIRANGSESTVARVIGSDFKGNLSVVLYAGGVGLAFVTPIASYLLYATVGIIWFLPDRRFVQQFDADSESPVTPPDPQQG